GPAAQRLRCHGLGAIVDERMVDARTLEPVACLAAGVAIGESVKGDFHRSLRSNSLMPVLARVFASTCLTMTAAYRLCVPSVAGRLPATTTLHVGTRPYVTSLVARL